MWKALVAETFVKIPVRLKMPRVGWQIRSARAGPRIVLPEFATSKYP